MKPIAQMEPWFGKEEQVALSDYMEQGGWLTEFRETEAFENSIAEYTGSKHCIAVNNGTISLSVIALSLGIGHGDEVLVPNYTMIATPNSLKLLGAKPVFVDVERETLCMDIDEARKAITSKTKAIFFVNANGRNPKSGIEAFRNLASENNIFLVEDSAQSLGSCYEDGQHQGTAGIAGSFSFSAPKIISTGQGGAIITNSDELNLKIRKMKDFGRSGGGNDVHDSLGFNFKFTDLQAVVGNVQLKKLAWRVERKKEILGLYRSGLEGVKGVEFFDQDLKNTTPWFIDVLVENRDELKSKLQEEKVGTREMYPPINKQLAYNESGNFPVCEEIGKKGLWLPSSAQLTDAEIIRVCEAISSFYK